MDGAAEAGADGATDGVLSAMTNEAVADLAHGAVVGAVDEVADEVADEGVDGMEEVMVGGSLVTEKGVHCGIALCTYPVRIITLLTNPQHIM